VKFSLNTLLLLICKIWREKDSVLSLIHLKFKIHGSLLWDYKNIYETWYKLMPDFMKARPFMNPGAMRELSSWQHPANYMYSSSCKYNASWSTARHNRYYAGPKNHYIANRANIDK
jgi:hypothetical protein